MTDYTQRFATLDDAEKITQHRYLMFVDIGKAQEEQLQVMNTAFETWVRDELAAGQYIGVFMIHDTEIVAGAGLWLEPRAPGPSDASTVGAKIVNVYVNPEHRRKGLARCMMQVLLDEARTRHLKSVVLHASDEGRGLYESMGFAVTNEMRLELNV
ncbi:MAG: GNAT family N-acetyltransferase [Aggregatilineales bacterium]